MGHVLPLPDLGLPLANPVHLFQKWNEWPGGIIDHHITSVDDPEAGSGSSSCPLHISSGTDILPKRPDDREQIAAYKQVSCLGHPFSGDVILHLHIDQRIEPFSSTPSFRECDLHMPPDKVSLLTLQTLQTVLQPLSVRDAE